MSSGGITVNLDRAIENVRIVEGVDELNLGNDRKASRQRKTEKRQEQQHSQAVTELNAEKQHVMQLSGVLERICGDLQGFYENTLSESKEQIVNLAVKIAEKIVAAKIEQGEYDITGIIQDTVSELKASDISVIKLNPDDLQTLHKIQEENGENKEFKGMKFEEDPNTGRGECKVQTSRGTIEKIIDSSLERIEQSLLKKV